MKVLHHSSDSIKVLHVDDDESKILFLREFLQIYDSDIHLDSVFNPLEVLEKLRNNGYDCLVIDFKMPQMNGIELAQMIRKEYSVPIILYTGQGSEEVAEKAFEAGINDYLRKELNPQHYQVLAKRIRDVVEKQRIEQVYTSIVNEAQDAIALVLGEGIVFANPAFVKLVGASSEKEVYGISGLSLISVEDKEPLQRKMKRLLKEEATNVISEIEIIRFDGKTVPVEINSSIIEYRGQKAFLFNMRDISERKTLETEIRKSEQRYRSLFELAPDGIITIDTWGNVTWINPAYTDITGFTQEEIVGKKVWSIGAVRAPDVKMFLRLFYEMIRGKSFKPIEFQWVSKDGKLGWGEGRASLIKADNKNSEVLLILRDITDRKEMEEDLKRYSKEMELLAEERAQKLVESERMVAIGAIASTVAHDLRGPLSVIRNAVYLLDKKPENSQEVKQMIATAVDNAVDMLNDIRGKASEEILHYEDVEIASFIESIIDETPIPSRIDVSLKLRKVNVSIDRLKIRRVVDNLIRNAVEAIPDKGKITISNKVEEDRIVISVKDTGVGIRDEALRELFKPFKTTKKKGTGLGLFYCKKTLEAHGGSIEAKSKFGSGTTFTFNIPLKKGMEEESAKIMFPYYQKQDIFRQ